jgi:A/G-specific adenine glycosylase
MTVSKRQNKMKTPEVGNLRKKILSWYDKHQRALPWRAIKGETPNPYHVWLSEIMLQQTTVITVGPYFQKFLTKWPTIHDLARADKEEVMHEWAGLGYYARARNLHKCAQTVSNDLNGVFPEEQKELEKLSGIGGYTSAAIRAIAFDKPANVVDGNIERVMARIYAVTEPMPGSKLKLKELAGGLSIEREDRPGDYAQALMDLGATICTPRSPKCSLCPVNDLCLAREQGIAADLPTKKPKKAKPKKYGKVYWITNSKGEVRFERRHEAEMLGGMLGLPTSSWNLEKKGRALKGGKTTKLSILHSFTHFDLELAVYTGAHGKVLILPENNPIWVTSSELESLGLPTLFSKVLKLMK